MSASPFNVLSSAPAFARSIMAEVDASNHHRRTVGRFHATPAASYSEGPPNPLALSLMAEEASSTA